MTDLRTQKIAALDLSEFAQHVMAEQLHHIGATHVQLRLAAQDVPCQTLELKRQIRNSKEITADSFRLLFSTSHK